MDLRQQFIDVLGRWMSAGTFKEREEIWVEYVQIRDAYFELKPLSFNPYFEPNQMAVC